MKYGLYILLIGLALPSCHDPLTEVPDQNNPVVVFDRLWAEVDRHYAFFGYDDLDWDQVYAQYRPQVNPNATEAELFTVASAMLSELNDPHTNVYTNQGVGGSIGYFSQFPINQLDDIGGYFSTYQSLNRALDYGLLQGTALGYIKIRSFQEDAEAYQAFAQACQAMPTAEGFIIDVRGNRGGYISNARAVLEQLTLEPRQVSEYRYRNGPGHGDYSAWEAFSLHPAEANPTKHLPLVVLTNRQSFSACEWFVMGCDALPQAQLVGDTTGGGSAIPIVRELPNGWVVRISNSQMERPAKGDFQFTGIYPDVPVWIAPEEAIQGIDTILERAIELLDE